MRNVLAVVFTFAIAPLAWGQEGVVERAGRSLDNAGKSIRRGVENAVDSVQSGIEQSDVRTRTYYRLRWDKALANSTLTLIVKPGGTVVLQGAVSDAITKKRAIELAQSTVGVTAVVDELVVGKARVVRVSPGSPAVPDREIPPVKDTEIAPAPAPVEKP